MEIYSISTAALSLNSSLGRAFTQYLYSKFMSWKLKRRLHAVILMKGCSTLCQRFSSSEHLFLDIDLLFEQLTAPKEAAEANKPATILESFMAYPILRNHLYNISRAFKKDIIIVSKSHDLVRALNIASANTHFFAFSKEMDERTGPLFPDEKAHAESIVKKLRTREYFDENHIVVCETMADLEAKLKHKFGILRTEI